MGSSVVRGIRLTASDAILRQLADQHRRVLSPWRALILLRRATMNTPASDRRWSRLPESISEVLPIMRTMERNGDLASLPDHGELYQVSTPYAQMLQLDEREILAELDPWLMVSHLSALTFRGLTVQVPQVIMVTTPRYGIPQIPPVDSRREDWEGIAAPPIVRPDSILGTPVIWQVIPSEHYLGFEDDQPYGATLRVTTTERTLIDGLQRPDLTGGIENVFRAWVIAAPILDLNQVADIVDRLGDPVLSQRVGFVLERLGLTHPALDRWRVAAGRAASSRLVATEASAPSFDERWNLSINAPTEALDDDAA